MTSWSAAASSVRKFLGYLDCGVLGRGFGFLQCTDPECRDKLLAAFSCKGRGWCPSCLGRTMAETSANWVEHVLPSSAPLRQWVLTLPFELRARVAYDRERVGWERRSDRRHFLAAVSPLALEQRWNVATSAVWRIAAYFVGTAMLGISCTLIDSPPPARERAPAETVSTHAEPLSDPGIEKLVPIRFVHVLNAPGAPDPATYQSLLRALNAANEVFKAGGVQFALRSIERYHMPNFADLRQASPCGGGGEVDRTWANVRAELQAVFPGTPQNAWIDSTPKTNRLWLTSVETLYGKPEEMVVWLSALTSCGNGFWSAFPWSGRNLVLNGPAIAGEPYKLAHELGHYFGLVHSFNMDTARDPETNTPHVMSDRFDLVYKRGTSAQNPHAFYSSKEAAAANEASLRLIEEYNCTTPADGGAPSCASPCSWNGGTISCTIGDPAGYTEVHNLGSAALKGLGFTFASGIGFNVMSYAGPFGEGASRAFGHSDVQLVRRFLRWDLQLDQAEADLIKPNTVMSGRRPRLGAWDLRGADAKIDFDADGRRDFGVWTPPTDMVSFGSFRVLLSSQAYSVSAGQSISVQFGRLGDVPVVADYNGDGRTDVGVFQPGGGVNRDNPLDTSGIWRWCTTASTPASTTCGHEGAWPGPIAFGLRDAVPQPGLDFDGTTNGELAYYRPATGEWTWQTIGVGQQSRQLGTAGSVPLPGLYDGDSKTDIAIYDPYSAEFKLLRSEQSWNTVTTRAFDSKFIPLPNGTGQDRAAGIPLAGVTAAYCPNRCFCPTGCAYVPRRAFTIYFPYDSSWNTLWNPVAGGTVQVCYHGWGAVDTPLPGLDRNGDLYSELVTFRARNFAQTSTVYVKNATPAGGCSGAQLSPTFPSITGMRTRAIAVPDMTGDGKAEIVFVQPDLMTISWATSESNYATVNSRQIGDQRSVFF